MNKAIIAVRSCSQASTASHRSVLYVLASYSNREGDNAFPTWETLAKESGASRPTVHRAIREALKFGEIRCTGERKSKVKVYSFAPLIAHSLTLRPSHPETRIVSRDQAIVSPGDSHSLTLRPDQAVISKDQKKNKKNSRDATLVSNTGLSVSGSPNGKAQMEGKKWREERGRRERELASLTAQLKSKPDGEVARRVAALRSELNGGVRRGLDAKEPEAAEELRESV